MTKKKCEHGKRKAACRVCNPNVICEYGKWKGHCRVCNPAKFCEHGKYEPECRVCTPSLICEHGKWKYHCNRCNPESFYQILKRESKRRQISFELTLEEVKYLVSSPCTNCGEFDEPIGIDRERSDYGYRFDNCQPMCEHCNFMKLDYTDEEFDKRLIKIFQHRSELAERAGFVKSLTARD